MTRRRGRSPGVARCQRGFSLLEVLVAFAILALSLGVLLQVFSHALAATAASGDYARAIALAEARLNAVGADIPLEEGEHSGATDDGLSWNLIIEPYQPEGWLGEAPALQAYRIVVVVVWPEGAGARRVALRSLALGAPP